VSSDSYYDAETGLSYNYFRDYDPSVGRFVESDPIGQHGGLNTYSYVLNSPVDYVDSLGALRQGGGFTGPTDPKWQSVEQAEAKIRNELQKAAACHANGKDYSCIPPFVAENLSNMLFPFVSRLDMSFVNYQPGRGNCGGGATPGWNINLGPQSFTQQCGCLASTIYHELLHNIGLDHPDTQNGPGINQLEAKCMSHLCGK
jgi:RHS repeat-associated protein